MNHLLKFRVAVPHHFNADPESDPVFNLDADPYPTLHQSDGNLRPLTDLYTFQGPILSLQTSSLSFFVRPRLYFEPLKLLI